MTRIVPAVARAMELLELYLDGASALSVPDVVAKLNLPRSTAHELVQTLVSKGYLAASRENPNRFVLGMKVFELGGAYVSDLDLAQEGRKVAEWVVARCDETTQVAVLDGTQVVYLASAESTHPIRMVSAVGRRLPAHVTAQGKMLLSELSNAEVVARYAGKRSLPGMTSASITSMDALLRELDAVRDRGIALDVRESNWDMCCVAAPIYDRDGAIVAAISISTPATRMSDERRVELAQLAKEGGEELSRRLGYRPGPRPAGRHSGLIQVDTE